MTVDSYLEKFPNGAPEEEWPQCVVDRAMWPQIVGWAKACRLVWGTKEHLMLADKDRVFDGGDYNMLSLWRHPDGTARISRYGSGMESYDAMLQYVVRQQRSIKENDPDFKMLGPVNVSLIDHEIARPPVELEF